VGGECHFGPGENLALPWLYTEAAAATQEKASADERRSAMDKSQDLNHVCLLKPSLRIYESANALLEKFAVYEAKSLMTQAHFAVAVNQQACRHPLHTEFLRLQPLGVENDAEARRMLLKKARGRGVLVVDVNGDNHQSIPPELLL
jgi:hypothetical protein